MGLFGFGSKKDKTPAASANDTYTLTGPAGPAFMQCMLAAGIRGVDMTADTSGSGTVTMTHGPVTVVGTNAIECYLDFKGQGAPLKPKKARVMGDQYRWIEIANQMLATDTKVDEILNRMNEILGEQDFLVGPLTMADSHLAACLFALKKANKVPGGLANIDAWLKRVEESIPANIRSNCMAQVN